MKQYNPHEIEPRWQKAWEDADLYKVTEDHAKPKKYVLEMFPYPSGDIHMGHVRNYTIGDVIARYSKMRGFDVLHPMGWDAFGLPAENAAIKHHSHPAKWTYANIETQKASFKRMGLSYDWDRTVVACDPEYYRWGQWIFLQFWKRGLVERRNSPVNWCPKCQTVLANEQVTEGECWRCHSAVEKRDLTQWYLKITDYAQELLDDLDQLDGWPERVKQMQANWIGRSEGAEVKFTLCDKQGNAPENPTEDDLITVFTTRADTLFMAPPDKELQWNEDGLAGMHKFLNRVWRMVYDLMGKADEDTLYQPGASEAEAAAARKVLLRERHRVAGKVVDDFDRNNFNTAIAAIMELVNAIGDYLRKVGPEQRAASADEQALAIEVANVLVRLLAPICPHMTDELWHDALGCEGSIHTQEWPEFDPEKAKDDEVELAVQINGKVKARITVAADADQEAVKAVALEAVQDAVAGKDLKKVVVVPGRLVNIVAK